MARPPKTERNTQVVYDATVELMTVSEIAEKYGITASRVYQILKDQAQQQIPEEVHTAMHALGLRTIKKAALEIMNTPGLPMFDVKGNPMYKAGTEVWLTKDDGSYVFDRGGHRIAIDGEPVYDPSVRIKAMDQYTRADREERLLYARDAPKKQEIIISQQQRSEAQQAVEALRRLILERPDVAREAMLPKAIEGHVELRWDDPNSLVR